MQWQMLPELKDPRAPWRMAKVRLPLKNGLLSLPFLFLAEDKGGNKA